MFNIINRINAVFATIGLLVTPFIFNVATANADQVTAITIPVDTVIFADKGSTTEVAREDIPAKYVGLTCSATAVSENQSSVHPGNNLVVESNGSTITLADVEREAGVSTDSSGSLTMGNKVVVSLVMGNDGVFSAGMDLHIMCDEPEVEVCRDGAVVTVKQSARKDTDTDAPCPEPQIEVCRDGTVITIDESDKKDTDTNAPCPVEKVSVCRDGDVIEIEKDKVKEGDVVANECPEEEEEGEVKPATLPNTGAGSTALLVSSVLGAGLAGHVYVNRKQNQF